MSNQSGNGHGFNMIYANELCQNCSYEDGCGGFYRTTSHLLTSPRYPDLYPRAQNCIYTISQEENSYINMTIINFDVNCANDFLEIRDGQSVDSPLLGRYCGDATNVPEYLTSTKNFIWIR